MSLTELYPNVKRFGQFSPLGASASNPEGGLQKPQTLAFFPHIDARAVAHKGDAFCDLIPTLFIPFHIVILHR